MVGDERHRRPLAHRAQTGEVVEESLAGNGIEPLARLIQHQQPRRRHESARDQDPLAFALRKDAEWPGREVGGADRPERGNGARLLRSSEGAISADRSFQARKHDRSRIFRVRKPRLEGGGDEADLLAQLAQVGAAEPVAQHLHRALAGPLVGTEDAGEGGLSRAVRPEHGPMLAGLDDPLHVAEDFHPVAAEGPDLDARHLHRKGAYDRSCLSGGMWISSGRRGRPAAALPPARAAPPD